MAKLFAFLFLLAGGSFALDVKLSESKAAFAVYDENADQFVIVDQEPPREKYVAGATFTNSINQTG